jgi:hypothetical protein
MSEEAQKFQPVKIWEKETLESFKILKRNL